MRRHTEELKEMVGEWLARGADRGAIKLLSQSLKVSPKTLNNWKRRKPKRPGRPKYTATQRKAALIAVARESRRRKYPGEKEIEKALPHVPLRLIREYVAALKAKRRKRIAAKRAAARVSVTVKATNVIVAQDGAHLGRDGREPVDAQIAKDRASKKIVIASVGPPTESHVLAQLKLLKETRGLPLVLSTDNGSAYCTESVANFLEAECVIHLRSLPRTPQHNASVERAVRELKEASALGCGTAVTQERASAELEDAAYAVNANRYRGGTLMSANRLDESLPAAYNFINPKSFYAECRAAMWNAREAAVGWRAKRMAERSAVYATLEKFGLVEITKGGR